MKGFVNGTPFTGERVPLIPREAIPGPLAQQASLTNNSFGASLNSMDSAQCIHLPRSM